MPVPTDMPRRGALHMVRPAVPAEVDQALNEVDVILNFWLDKGYDMDSSVWLTEITTNNIQGDHE